ncbi:hypothetical protein AB4Z40_31420 [Bosea sp. 2YAB26]|uniref:hypothetical protein n=1 Tax=Bosea sp. 2YAB26 TaxID=3237478 RepID=UPI003F91B995
MNGVKLSAIVLAISAALAGPALAQGVSVDTQTRGKAQGKIGGPAPSAGGNADVDAEVVAPRIKAGGSGHGSAGAKAGKKATGAAGASGTTKVDELD